MATTLDALGIRTVFPGLAKVLWGIRSERDTGYNCIAWAAEESHRIWWPDGIHHWPTKERTETVGCFTRAFATLGYSQCADGSRERGRQKVAIYVLPSGEVKHMARQVFSGRWTSKLGPSQDIVHHAVEALEGHLYGKVVRYLARRNA